MANNGEFTDTQKVILRLIIFAAVVIAIWYFFIKKKDTEANYSSSKQLAIYPRLTGVAPMDRQILENFNTMQYEYKC